MIQNSKSIHPSRLDEFMCWYYRLSVLKLNSIRSDQQIVERKKAKWCLAVNQHRFQRVSQFMIGGVLGLYRCWWRMLVTDSSRILVVNIMIQSPTSYCHHCELTNITIAVFWLNTGVLLLSWQIVNIMLRYALHSSCKRKNG